MVEAEGFLARWSRLKRGEEERGEEARPQPVEPAPEPPEAETVDLASLPPLDSLCAESDYTAFLKEGVPEELRRLALRKAWTSDPAISGFRGLAEYDWDCNAPGFAALLPTDDVARLCDAILGKPPEPPAPAAPAAPPEPGPALVAEAAPDEAPPDEAGPA